MSLSIETVKQLAIDPSQLPPPLITKTDQEWRDQLQDELTFQVTRKCDTENAFCGAYYKNKDVGVYTCICCDAPLFESGVKFNSGTGWPSFVEPIRSDSVLYVTEGSARYYFEVKCRQCHAHLGHVFNDGPKEQTGLRFCINSVCLKFNKQE